jgi:hypothetical protein
MWARSSKAYHLKVIRPISTIIAEEETPFESCRSIRYNNIWQYINDNIQ